MGFFEKLLKNIFGVQEPAKSMPKSSAPVAAKRRTGLAKRTGNASCINLNESVTVRIISENSGGYIVAFKDSTEGFMPFSQSGFEEKKIGGCLKVIVTAIEDKPIVSRKAFIQKQNKTDKEALIQRAVALLDEPDCKGANQQWFELLQEWKTIGYTPDREALWKKFASVKDQLDKRSEIRREESKALYEELRKEIFSQFQRGYILNSTVVKISEKGIVVRISDLNVDVTGFVPKRELSYSYIDDISEFVKVGDSRRVVVLAVDAEKQHLILGMRQIETVVPDHEEEVNDDLKEEPVSEQLMVTVKKVKYPGLIIIESFDDYDCGIVLPTDITLNGAPICVSAIIDLTKNLSQGDPLPATIKSVSPDKKIAFLNYNIVTEQEFEINNGATANVTIRNKCDSYVTVETPDNRLAYINNSEFNGNVPSEGTVISSRLVDLGENILQYARYSTINLDLDYDQAEVVIASDRRLREIFEEEELEELRQSGTDIIEQLQVIIDRYPELLVESNRKELDFDIAIKATMDSEVYRSRFEESHPSYFAGRSMKIFVDIDQEELYLWDENETLIIAERDENNRIRLKRLYFDNKNPGAHSKISRMSAAKLLINGDHITLFPYKSHVPANYFNEVWEKAKAIQFIDKQKYDLKKQVREELRANAELYQSASRYLDWQIDQEKGKVGDAIFIDSEHIGQRVIGWKGCLALSIAMSDIEARRLFPDDQNSSEAMEDDIRVLVYKDDNSQNSVTATLSEEGSDRWRLEFSRATSSLDWLKGGFHLQLKPSVRHLRIQKYAIEEYVKRDNLDMLTDIVYGQLEEVDQSCYHDLKFFNPIFNSTEDDNRQAEAVKKALAAEKIMLIQGPPGTGKTTVIVEIIRQLVRQNKRILVCCQANPAVDNIFDKLEALGKDHPSDSLQLIRVRNEGELESSSRERNAEIFSAFLHQQVKELKLIEAGRSLKNINQLIDTALYKSEDALCSSHQLLIDLYPKLKDIDSSTLIRAFEQLSEDPGFHRFYNNRECDFRHADVVLGTCIGVGMTRGLSKGMFDVVIIDEAAKANVGESIVPMQLGKKYILVGDDQQLPPYVDIFEIKKYVESGSAEESVYQSQLKQIVGFQKTSLFEDIHHKIPESCVVTLNYQHRMNPRIGDCISHLFYSDSIKNGPHTSECVVESSVFQEHVTFVDTTQFQVEGKRWNEKLYEEKTLGGSLLNEKEAGIICEHIIPAVQDMIGTADPMKFLGIITPYSAQVNLLRNKLPERFRNCVHTIDSIQGSEYEVVVFSFVRSFSKKYATRSDVNIGFVADMRRLNVSLSRAKCKLIMVGNLKTLTNPDAYSHISQDVVGVKHPIEVFKKMSRYRSSIDALTPKSIFINTLQTMHRPGYVIKNCRMSGYGPCKDIFKFSFLYDGEEVELYAKASGVTIGQTVDIIYVGDNDNNRPLFKAKRWNEEQEKTIRRWLSEKSTVKAMVVKIGEKVVTLSVQDIEGTVPRSFFFHRVNKGERYKAQILDFDSEKGFLKFKIVR